MAEYSRYDEFGNNDWSDWVAGITMAVLICAMLMIIGFTLCKLVTLL